jgi:hypothetical protein
MHASALASRSRCIAVCGRSTAGKSTLALAGLGAGFTVVADDALGVFMDHKGPVALTLPFELRPRLGPGRAGVTTSPPLEGAGGDRLELSAIVILKPDSSTEVELGLLTPAEAFGCLMPHAYCFSLADSKERLVREYTDIAASVDVYELRYPREHEAIQAMIGSVAPLLGP